MEKRVPYSPSSGRTISRRKRILRLQVFSNKGIKTAIRAIYKPLLWLLLVVSTTLTVHTVMVLTKLGLATPTSPDKEYGSRLFLEWAIPIGGNIIYWFSDHASVITVVILVICSIAFSTTTIASIRQFRLAISYILATISISTIALGISIILMVTFPSLGYRFLTWAVSSGLLTEEAAIEMGINVLFGSPLLGSIVIIALGSAMLYGSTRLIKRRRWR